MFTTEEMNETRLLFENGLIEQADWLQMQAHNKLCELFEDGLMEQFQMQANNILCEPFEDGLIEQADWLQM